MPLLEVLLSVLSEEVKLLTCSIRQLVLPSAGLCVHAIQQLLNVCIQAAEWFEFCEQ